MRPNEIGAEDRRHADHHEQHRQIEGEGREFGALGEAGDPAVERGTPADRILPDVGQEGGRAGLHNLDIQAGSVSSESPYIFFGDLLGLAEAALANEPHRRFRQVVTHDEDHQRRYGADERPALRSGPREAEQERVGMMKMRTKAMP
jgi:hypothetical protein